MALIKTENKTLVDTSQIHRGDCIRVRRAADTTVRNGFVTEVDAEKIRLLYCNTQNYATSYLDITAADLQLGAYEVWWTTDFETVNHHPEETSADSGGE